MSNLPDKMWDSLQKEYECHCSNDASLLLNAPYRVCLCEYLDKSYYAAHGICVKNSLVHL